MNKEQELGGFLNQVKTVVEGLENEVKGKKRGLIVIATEEVEDGTGQESVIAILGAGKQVTEGLGKFLTTEKVRPLVHKALAFSAIEKFAEMVAEKADKEEAEEGAQEAGTKEEEQSAK